MIKHAEYIILVVIPVLVVSCFEKDEPVEPYPGEVVEIENNVNAYQSYFDFETSEIKASHPVDAWQLGFESSAGGWHVLVNSGAGWFVWNTRQQDINASDMNNEPLQWDYDVQHKYPDSTAIGNWTSFQDNTRKYTNDVYILGESTTDGYIHRKRIRFFHVDTLSYGFYFKDEETGLSDSITIIKPDSLAFTYYNFNTREQKNLEPGYALYDIVFCPYYDKATLFGVTIPYLVRGVLLNTCSTMAVLDSVNTYEQIDYELLDMYEFSGQRDAIGYQWKSVSVNTSEGSADYSIKSNYNYVVRTSDGNYYKLRFLSFSLDGVSGYPQFEYKLLNPVQ